MNDTKPTEEAQDLTEISDTPETVSEDTTPEPTNDPKAEPARKSVVWPGVMAIIAVLATSSGAVYFWQQNEAMKQRLTIAETRLADQDARGQREIRELGTEAMTRINALESNTRRIDGMQGELQRAMDSVRHFAAKGPVGWVLAEVEFLLKIANHRVHLNNDPETALAALQSADERLRSLADPGLIPVREKIAEEIQALKAIPPVDRTGIAVQLKAMAQQVATLPLPGRPDTSSGERTSQTTDQELLAGPIEEAPAKIWQEVKSLVTVRRHDKPVPQLLAPEEQYFLHWNLKLQLESARLNALRSQQNGYQADLHATAEDIRNYFLVEKPETQNFLEQVDNLAKLPVTQEMPDISSSLRLLRAQAAKLIAQSTTINDQLAAR